MGKLELHLLINYVYIVSKIYFLLGKLKSSGVIFQRR